jgi:hypothetical protein
MSPPSAVSLLPCGIRHADWEQPAFPIAEFGVSRGRRRAGYIVYAVPPRGWDGGMPSIAAAEIEFMVAGRHEREPFARQGRRSHPT